MDILVQPMQRLTKYGLLLKAILKNTDEDVEKESLQSMVSSFSYIILVQIQTFVYNIVTLCFWTFAIFIHFPNWEFFQSSCLPTLQSNIELFYVLNCGRDGRVHTQFKVFSYS